ncbi:hypothetical protein QSV34_10800 [Porticoccus sp. W117]|uniref:hypothetical protein n=1 Tax=Porticoccus sp. W117 TaxID=3054777 RepID=UPI002597C010|nr:hypothetical protein [Porticoccus sp. W117]MDM3871838.1 hypothetical protein [Porticoccus sp. W117]
MSEPKKVKVWGPQPVSPENLYIVGAYYSGDDIGVCVAYIADLNDQYSMTEKMVRERMDDMEYYAATSTPGGEQQRVTQREYEIMHHALAHIQRDKIERDIPLDTPLFPHPDFNLALPPLRGVPTPESP